jgi:hypothetical protein
VNGGTLGGTGAVGTVNAFSGGTVSPGLSPGSLNCSNLSLNSSGTYFVELNGTNAGVDYDQLNVTGTVSLGQGALLGTVGFNPPISNSFVIIKNDGADAVLGTFFNVANGNLLPVGGYLFRISYAGGDGNDVELTRVLAPRSQISAIASLSNGFTQLQGLGISNLNYTIQANSNLSTTNWIVLGTAPANGSGVFSFTDTNAPSFPMRFYRAVSP